MSLQKFISIILIINIFYNAEIKCEQIKSDCLIHNLKYSFEYLYINKENLSTLHLGSVDDYNKIRWLFEPVDDETSKVTKMANKTFYIRTQQYGNKYLCATNKFEDTTFKMRRKIETRTEKSFDCQWRLDEIPTKSINHTFRIINVNYNQPLYAASFLFRNKMKRNVFLWHKKSTSKEFGWIIDCMKGFFVII